MTGLPTDVAAAPPPLPAPQRVVKRPTFLGALHGIWLFTWRPQLTWRRLPAQLVGLLILPALVYLTTPSPVAWTERHVRYINPPEQINILDHRLIRAHRPLRPEQRRQLIQIFDEEANRLNDSAAGTHSGDQGAEKLREELRRVYQRIQDRAQPVLDPAQFDEFRKYEQRAVMQGQAQITPTWGRTEAFYHWLLDLYFFAILPLQCARASGALIRDELQADTLGFLLTRPVSRARLLVVKYVAQTAWLELAFLVETGLLFAVGMNRQLPNLGSLLPLLLTAQVLAVPAWSALGVFFGLITKRYMPLALLYGLIVEMGIGRIPTNVNTVSVMRHLKSLLARDSSVEDIYKWTAQGLPLTIGALLFASVLFVALAVLLFTFKEYHHTAEMQK